MKRFVLFVLSATLILAACGDSQSAGVPTPTAQPTAIATVQSATSAPVFTITPPDTPLPSPADTATSAPTATSGVVKAAATTAPISTEIPATAAPTKAVAVQPTTAPVVDPNAASYPCQPSQIKGNRKSMIYHVPTARDYAKTKADVVCFDTEQAAVAAGYRKAQR